VIDIYDDLREPHRKGRAMISRGLVLGYAGWPEEAIRQIRKGLGLVDWDREPRLVLMARHNLAWFLNDCGRSEEALRHLERFRHTYNDFSDAWTTLRLAWLDGRIAGGLGRVENAEKTLREVRRRFLDEGHGYDAALVTLDLAHLHLEKGRAAEVRTLAGELLDLFLSHDIHRQALAALAVFQKAVDMDDATPSLAQAVSSYLVRARRNPQLRFEKAAA
jgi:tetratricopeptide (TPR) repeat protein